MCYLHLPTRGVYGELEKLGTRHRLALRLAKDPRHWSWWCCRMFSFSTLVHPSYNIHWANIIWNRLWTYIWMYGKTLSHSFDFEHGTWSELRLPEADLSAQGYLCGRLHPLKSRRTQMLHCLHQRQGFKEKNPKGGSKYATIFVSHQFADTPCLNVLRFRLRALQQVPGVPIMSVARGMFKVERVPEQIDKVPIKCGPQNHISIYKWSIAKCRGHAWPEKAKNLGAFDMRERALAVCSTDSTAFACMAWEHWRYGSNCNGETESTMSVDCGSVIPLLGNVSFLCSGPTGARTSELAEKKQMALKKGNQRKVSHPVLHGTFSDSLLCLCHSDLACLGHVLHSKSFFG